MAGKSSHGTFRKRDKEGSLGGSSFRIMVSIIGLVVLVSLIAMALVLRELREEHVILRKMAAGHQHPEVAQERGEEIGLEERLEALEEMKREQGSLAGPTPSEEEFRFREAAIRALAKLLHQYEAGSPEIAELIGAFPEAERKKLIEYLESEAPEVPGADTGFAEEELKEVPSPVAESDSVPIRAHGSGPVLEEFSDPVSGSPVPAEIREHAVQPGETLSGIARFHEVPVSKIMELNEIGNPNRIRVGRVLKIPVVE